jgi:hypothetical protein
MLLASIISRLLKKTQRWKCRAAVGHLKYLSFGLACASTAALGVIWYTILPSRAKSGTAGSVRFKVECSRFNVSD